MPTSETAIIDACGRSGFIEQVNVTGTNYAGSRERFIGVETRQAINKVEYGQARVDLTSVFMICDLTASDSLFASQD